MKHNNSNLAEKQVQTEISVVEKQQADVKTAKKDKPAERKNAKPVSEAKKTEAKEKKKVKPVSGEKKTETAEKNKIKPISEETNKPAGDQKGRAESREEFESRMRKRDEARVIRREERRKKVRRQKIAMAVCAGVVAAAGVVLAVLGTPAIKLSRCLAKGGRYTEQSDYANAQSAYEKALKIDTGSVEAYRGMADNYVAQGNIQGAKQILYTGWEQTNPFSVGRLAHFK